MKDLLLIIFTLFTFISTTTFAQQKMEIKDPAAAKVLDQMSAKYKAVPAFRAKFKLQVYKGSELKDSSKGNITVKGNKYRLNIEGQVYYNNEEHVWTHMVEEKEVYVSDYDPSESEGEVKPTDVPNLYKKGFKYLLNNSLSSSTIQVVDLSPEIPESKKYFKIRISIDKTTHVLKRWEIFYKTGERFKYVIEYFNDKISVTDSYFEFKSTDKEIEIYSE